MLFCASFNKSKTLSREPKKKEEAKAAIICELLCNRTRSKICYLMKSLRTNILQQQFYICPCLCLGIQQYSMFPQNIIRVGWRSISSFRGCPHQKAKTIGTRLNLTFLFFRSAELCFTVIIIYHIVGQTQPPPALCQQLCCVPIRPNPQFNYSHLNICLVSVI